MNIFELLKDKIKKTINYLKFVTSGQLTEFEDLQLINI
jgi:hypothetical protein